MITTSVVTSRIFRTGVLIACILWLAAALPLFAQGGKQTPAPNLNPDRGFTPPRLKDGKPNFQGMWAGTFGTRGGPGNARLFGGIEYVPSALAIKNDFAGRLGNDNLYFWCATGSVPTQVLYVPHPFLIFQNNDYFTLIHEYAHDVRAIPTNGSPHPDPKVYTGMSGDSRGHWEGDTFVVDTTNFSKGLRRMNMNGDFLDENSHIVERFTLLGPERMRYDLFVEDPTVLAKPWRVSDVLYRGAKDDFIFDTSCREGEQDVSHLTESPDYKPLGKVTAGKLTGGKKK